MFNTSLASEHRGSVTDIIRSMEAEEQQEEKHVLVVDDDNISRTVMSRMLEKLNFKVTTVDGGKKALELLGEDNSVSLVLVDVLMPEMDGLELLRIFKSAYAKDIPIIMISSTEDPDTIAQCFQSGAEDFLQKPIRFEMLKRRVEMCLDDRLRRRKETMYQEMLKKERENRNRLSKQVEAQEKELQQIKSQISDTIETPMQVVMKTIGDLMEGSYSVEQYKGALVAILKSLGSRDLYRPAFSLLLEKQTIDETTRKWLQSEFMREDEENAHHIRRSSQSQEPPLLPPPLAPSYSAESQSPTKKGVHFNESQNTSVESTSTEQHILLTRSIPTLDSFEFDVFAYQTDELLRNAAYMFQSLGLVSDFSIDPAKLMNFLNRLQQHYKSNPYHNMTHAIDVTQFVYSSLCIEKIGNFLNSLEKLCIMVSALCHDLDHPGLNNNYQVNAKTPLALLYNDISVLENHHCYVAFRLMKEPDCNIVENLDSETYREFRRTIINTILATDMAHHFEILTKFQTRIQTGPLSKESKDDKQQVINIILKCADVSNAIRPFPVAQAWAHMLIEEFLAQGDEERSQGLAISPLMDRNSLHKAQMQVNFIDYIAGPLFKCFVQYVPNLYILTNTMQSNRVLWSAGLIEKSQTQETTPESTSNQAADMSSKATGSGEVLTDDFDVVAKVRAVGVMVIDMESSAENQLSSFLRKFGFEVGVSHSLSSAASEIKNSQVKYNVAIVTDSDIEKVHDFIRELRQNEQSLVTKHYTAVLGLIFNSGVGLNEICDLTVHVPISSRPFLAAVEDCVELSMNHADCVDIDQALELSGGDINFTRELLGELLEEGKRDVIDFAQYIKEENWSSLNMFAHSIKGSSAQLACAPLSQASFVLERAAKGKEKGHLTQYLNTFQKRVGELERYLAEKL